MFYTFDLQRTGKGSWHVAININISKFVKQLTVPQTRKQIDGREWQQLVQKELARVMVATVDSCGLKYYEFGYEPKSFLYFFISKNQKPSETIHN